MSLRIVPISIGFDNPTSVNATANVYSSVIDMRNFTGSDMAIYLEKYAGTTMKISILITVANKPEGPFVIPTDSTGPLGTIVADLAASTWYQFTPPIAPYAKITLDGITNNTADVEIRAYMSGQEDRC
jgi:hypothetical protein